MSRLTTAAEKRIRSISRRPDLPGWWPMLQVLIGVVFFCYLAYRAISGSPDVPLPQPTDTSVVAQPDDDTVTSTTPSTSPQAPSTTARNAPPTTSPAPPNGEMVDVALASGGSTTVQASLVELARLAAAAAQGGPDEGVPVADGATLTAPSDPWTDATGTEVLLVSRTDSEVLFRVLVARESGSSSAWTTVRLKSASGGWVFSPS